MINIELIFFSIVQTGKYRKEDENKDEDIKVFKSIVEAIEHILA